MLRLVLPPRPRRPGLLGFWLAQSVLAGTVVLAAPLPFGRPPAFAFGGVLAVTLALVGIARPAWPVVAYRNWNRAARRVARAAEVWTLAVCYFVVFPVVGRAGSALSIERIASGSAWAERRTLAASSYPSLSAEPEGPGANDNWVGAILGWSRSSRNLWAFTLIPFLVLLRSFSVDRDEVKLDTNYTLY
jgi:hypothetical protein